MPDPSARSLAAPYRPRSASLWIALALCCPGIPAAADLVIAMPSASAIDSLTQEQIVNIFLGRFRQLPDGTAALPVDYPEDEPLRAEFYLRLVNKTPAQIRAYWARLVFSGKTAPPRQADSRAAVLEWLRHQPGAIGYLRSDQLEPALKAVRNLGPLP